MTGREQAVDGCFCDWCRLARRINQLVDTIGSVAPHHSRRRTVDPIGLDDEGVRPLTDADRRALGDRDE